MLLCLHNIKYPIDLKMKNTLKIITIVLLTIVDRININAQSVGYSGMAPLDDSSYVVVYDKKSFQSGNRIAILSLKNKNGYTVDELAIDDQKLKGGKASDLESICAIPDKKNEFFAVESSYWLGKAGRIFHIKINDHKVAIKNVYNIPDKKDIPDDEASSYNFEGSVCIQKDNKLFLILGERGGSKHHIESSLIVGVLEKGKENIDWKSYNGNIIHVKAPFSDTSKKLRRSISDLYLDQKGVLFASAAIDEGDSGPFSSIIYKIGTVSFQNDTLVITPSENSKPLYTIAGFKVESLSSSPSRFKDSKFSIGTEDENYPGVWRVLYRPLDR